MMRRTAPILVVVGFSACVGGCGLFKKKAPDYAAAPYDPAPPGQAYPHDSVSPPLEPAFASSAGTKYHTVARKETLFSLARSYYNDQSKWRTIYEANRAEIGDDPNKIRVGQRLVIP